MRKRVKQIKNSLDNVKLKFIVCFMVFYFIFLALNFIFGNNGYFRIKELQEERKKIIVEIEKIKRENEELSKEVVAARNNPFWVERVAREELDLVKDGEIVFKFFNKQGKR